MAELLNPNALKAITAEAEAAKINEMLAKRRKAEVTEQNLREAFQGREISSMAADRINIAVRSAAERGLSNVEVLRFPASFCNDGGRRINVGKEDWPESLEGFGKRAFEYYEKELRPLGFRLRAEIVSFPDGMPGDVGLFLEW